MRTFLFSLVLLLGACLGIQPLRAQVGAISGSVSGIVRNDKGDPLAGVTVVATSTANGFKAGTSTDTGGVFAFVKLPTKGKFTFTFSSVGFELQTLSDYEIRGNGDISILVKMKGQAGALNEVVVVGYGTQKKANVTGAVSQVSGDVLDRRSIPNLAQGLQGEIPNLQRAPIKSGRFLAVFPG